MKASILFVAYNQANFIAEAIQAAMAQDHPDLELVVCDDASTDDTRLILEDELTRCPAHITVVRAHSEKNVGLLANFNRGIAACSGDVIVPMAGDDVSMPNRVSAVVGEFNRNPNCMLVFSDWRRIDAKGRQLPGAAKKTRMRVFSYGKHVDDIYGGSPVYGAAAAYHRTLPKVFGPMRIGHHPEDRCYWVRALLLGEVRYLAEPLIHWRTHTTNINNFVQEADTPAARKKMARTMLLRQHYGLQHIRDIRLALDRSLIARDQAARLLQMIRIDRERQRLRRYSLTAVPWRLWFGSFRRALRLDFSIRSISRILFSDLGTRYSAKRRNLKWTQKFSSH